MIRDRLSAPQILPRRQLALSGALFVALASIASPATPAQASQYGHAIDSNTEHRSPLAPQTWVVQNCSDSSANSLRDIIESPGHAQSGDTVDLSQLPALCGVADSTITLLTGEIEIAQDALTLIGPMTDEGTVTISGGGASRVFNHTGAGGLSIEWLTVSNGAVHTASNAYGGCINGSGMNNTVYLYHSVVTNCHAISDNESARGGAIHAGGVGLVVSEVSGSDATAPSKRGYGGGIHANSLSANYATIRNNTAHAGAGGGSVGGGVYSLTGATVFSSTVDHNRASYGGGFQTRADSLLVNSTISDNTADEFIAAWYATGGSLSMWNSTISFNHAIADSSYGAVTFRGAAAASPLDLRSSIIANNTVGSSLAENDLTVFAGFGTLGGAASLVMVANVADATVIVSAEDPKLGALSTNGGPTRTRMLRVDSPARSIGVENGNPREQRGRGYPRTTGGMTDIGAVQFDSIFSGHFE